MGKRSIKIERLEVHLKGVEPHLARAATHDLGRDLLGHLASLSIGGRLVRIGSIDAGAHRLAGRNSASELRNIIARKVVASIESKLK
ncbi:MAG TPA: hypothetical protein VKB86_09085 [Pyrinomonadaceae bacterium]|nr:hypothetical protein [Pyrinomonadaceae bacterium]